MKGAVQVSNGSNETSELKSLIRLVSNSSTPPCSNAKTSCRYDEEEYSTTDERPDDDYYRWEEEGTGGGGDDAVWW